MSWGLKLFMLIVFATIAYGKHGSKEHGSKEHGDRSKQESTYSIDAIADYIKKHEELKTTPYWDTKGITYVGVGFNMSRDGAKRDWKKVLPKVDFDLVKIGEQEIKENEALKLLKADLKNIYIPRAKRIFPKFHRFCPELQSAIVDALFHGDLAKNIQALIKSRKWKEAGEKYIDQRIYKEVVEGEFEGPNYERIINRMNQNKAIFERQECDTPTQCEKDEDCECCNNQPYCRKGMCSECEKDQHCTKKGKSKCEEGNGGNWVCGDPHVSVKLNDGSNTNFCFDVVGKTGEIFQFVKTRHLEIRARLFSPDETRAANWVDVIAIRIDRARITVDENGISDGRDTYAWGSESRVNFGFARMMIRGRFAEIFLGKIVTEIEIRRDHMQFGIYQHGGFGPRVYGILGDVVNQGTFKRDISGNHGNIMLFGGVYPVTEQVKLSSAGKCWFLKYGHLSPLIQKIRDNYIKDTLF
ncbi:unnamed protein product [Owenia fusiformis]|uniref:Uncharacterized protein n=1 Tax=Owenia fusiformis TaxID=6347 RepID=A0A8J1XE91_OWEFU|nr:unnamed protein product [Owenia fusiformis]